MTSCPECAAPLERSPDGNAARCTRCAALFSGDLRPIRLEAPGGGFDPEFQAMFEANLGFAPRVVPNRPPSYWGGGAPDLATPRAGTPDVARIMQLAIAGFVVLILGLVAAYVAWVLYASLPH